MYATIPNHVLHFSQYLFALILLFYIIPRLIFKSGDWQFFERSTANYIRIVFLIIVMGYLLVLVKLYEVLTIVPVFIVLFLYRQYKTNAFSGWRDFAFSFEVLIYDIADGRIHPLKVFFNWLKRIITGGGRIVPTCFGSFTAFGNTLLLAATFGYAAYVRFYDSFLHAAPAMSDAYVTLAWMKYINGKVLFHDGIYPQGFHIVLATIQKFAAIDALYVLKYTGPLNALLICVGIYFVVLRLSRRIAPAMIAVIIYGLLGMYVFKHGEWMRQASTNSQEFGFVFILPTLYFFYLFLKNSTSRNLWIGFFGASVTGMVHTLAFAVVGVGMGLLVITALLVDFRKSMKNAAKICLAGIAAVLISLAPLGVGLLLGKGFHSSSAEFLTTQISNPALPQLNMPDYTALISLAILWGYSIFMRKPRKEKLAEKYIVLLGLGIFFIYYEGGVLTKSSVIASRSGEIWALFLPVAVGMGWYACSEIIRFLKRPLVGVLIGFCLLGYIFVYIKPEPIIPYKMEHDSYVEQYLRITELFRPTQWLIVSQEEGYSMVLGTSYHLMVQDFLAWYDPAGEKMVHMVDGNSDTLVSPDVFIYEDKDFLRTQLDEAGTNSLKVIYERKDQEKVKLARWLQIYQANHDNLSLFYEDQYLRVWQIHQPPSKKEAFNKLWES